MSNISKHEWQDILNLKKNKDIIIKEADKGGAVVIMNTKQYLKMISDHLNDEKTYKMVESNCDTKVMKGIKKIIEKYKDNLTKKEKEYLISFSYNTSNFYGLPKIHKSKLIQNAIKEQQKEYVHIIEPSDLKLRPIVAGPICPTRPLSNLIDILLKPFLLHVKSYVKDNLDFLSKYSRENYEDTLLVTFDVVNLYTKLPHTFGLEALDYWLENHPESLHARFNKEFVLECAKFILQNNNMKFNNEYYNQIKGTAMDTIFAQTYATLSMGYFQIKLYSVCAYKYGELLANYIKENWNRFLDDCYTGLRSSKVSPEELLLTLNSINPSIQFTMEYSKDQIPFPATYSLYNVLKLTSLTCSLIKPVSDLYIYICTHTETEKVKKTKRQTMCPPGYYQSANGLMIAHALGHMMYGYTLLVPANQKVLNMSSKEHYKTGLEVTHDTHDAQ